VIRFALSSLIQPTLYKSTSSYSFQELCGTPSPYFTYLMSLAKKLASIRVEFAPFRKGLWIRTPWGTKVLPRREKLKRTAFDRHVNNAGRKRKFRAFIGPDLVVNMHRRTVPFDLQLPAFADGKSRLG
jgi:hypothetical protein